MKTLESIICELWHVSKIALSGQNCGRYDRMIYIKTELLKRYPEYVKGMTNKQIWLTIETETT